MSVDSALSRPRFRSHSRARPLAVSLASIAGAATLLSLAACSTGGDETSAAAQPDGSSAYPVVVDNCGEEVSIEEQPESVLSVGTSALALLDAAGASDRITARAGEFGAELPADLTHAPEDAEILDPSDPGIESIIGAEPDIIVGYGLFNASEDDVAAAGIPNLIISGECNHDAALTEKTDFDAIFADVERLATVFGTQDAATEQLDELRAELEELGEATPPQEAGESAAVVYYFSDSAPMSARGGLGIADEVLARAGFDNVYGDEQSVYLEANVETLLEADPHTIVLAYGLYGESFEEARERLLQEPGAENLQAVREDRIVGALASDLAPDPGALRGLRTVLEGTGALAE